MKNLFEIFEENFDIMYELLEQDNFYGCSSISTDLITISIM